MSNASSSVIGTPPSSSSVTGDGDPNAFGADGRKSDSFRANTSKTKLESLLGESSSIVDVVRGALKVETFGWAPRIKPKRKKA